MDFQTFGDDNWEVKKWLNAAFAKDKRNGHAATLMTKLQEAAEQGTAATRLSRVGGDATGSGVLEATHGKCQDWV